MQESEGELLNLRLIFQILRPEHECQVVCILFYIDDNQNVTLTCYKIINLINYKTNLRVKNGPVGWNWL